VQLKALFFSDSTLPRCLIGSRFFALEGDTTVVLNIGIQLPVDAASQIRKKKKFFNYEIPV